MSSSAPLALTLFLRRWLILGLLFTLLLPAAREYVSWVGWLPYWLIAAPALSLGLHHLVSRQHLEAPAYRHRRNRSKQATRPTTRRNGTRPSLAPRRQGKLSHPV